MTKKNPRKIRVYFGDVLSISSLFSSFFLQMVDEVTIRTMRTNHKVLVDNGLFIQPEEEADVEEGDLSR